MMGLAGSLAPDKQAGRPGPAAACAHLSYHPSELTYQEVLSFKPPEPPQPPVSLEIGQ